MTLEPPDARAWAEQVADSWLERWEAGLEALLMDSTDFELGQAMGTAQGYVLHAGTAITPPQAERIGTMVKAIVAEHARRRKAGTAPRDGGTDG